MRIDSPFSTQQVFSRLRNLKSLKSLAQDNVEGSPVKATYAQLNPDISASITPIVRWRTKPTTLYSTPLKPFNQDET